MLMGKRLDASIETVFPADKVKDWRQKCGATHAELCESAVFLENGVLGWDIQNMMVRLVQRIIDIIESGDPEYETILHADRVDTSLIYILRTSTQYII